MDYLNTSTRFMIKKVILLLFIIGFVCQIHGYGFDGGASCSEKTTRRGRAQLLRSIPCDLTHQPYCNLPGSLYPWNAVRRFVHENQGLMKRMYGDVRHISVLRTEINNNDIGADDVEETAARYSRAGWKRNKYLYSDTVKSKNNDLLSESYQRRSSSTTSKPITKDRPTSSSTTTATSTTTTTSATTKARSNERVTATTHSSKYKKPLKSIADEADAFEEEIEAAVEQIFEQIRNDDGNTENNNVFTNVTDAPFNAEMESNNIKVVGAPDLSLNKTEAATISTTLRIFGFTKEEDTTAASALKRTTESSATASVEQTNNNSTDIGQDLDNLITTEGDDGEPQVNDSNTSESFQTETIVDVDGKQVNKIVKPGENPAGQLFQDVAQKDEPIFVSTRGVNACPVKEEVVAPFWANNTRGEVLALLNLYPFEQYVHWEKCTHEHKQMYCRDGCRCEQQYRLHRLLAYDPQNECRGIFSDWFRFPSCCICKCYDIPLEYRVTSRSPRSMDDLFKDSGNPQKLRHPIDVAEDKVQRAIYEHATNDWYRRTPDDFGDIEMLNDEEEQF